MAREATDKFLNYDRQQKISEIAERVFRFTAGYREYINPSYNETELRVEFINAFFRILGWDVDNAAGLPQHLREVTHEASVIVDADGQKRRKKPDYSFRIGSETLFFLEAKKPSVDITSDKAPAFQLRRYGWSGNLKISVLTNFSDLYIYDCSVRPTENDDVNVALIAHYSYTEYEEKFDEIYGLLSKDAVISGNFAAKFKSIKNSFRHEPFDDYFLLQIRKWRFELGSDIKHNNPDIDENTLNISVQRILNRIIFLRICEDRCFEQYETLKNITSYQELKELFAAADRKYDSGLFEVLEEDRITVSDKVLLSIFQDLYYPNNSYEFSVVDPHIIGQIYELFLEEKLSPGTDGTVTVAKKAEAVDSQGAVNTPKNITDIIVEQTLSDIFRDKSIAEMENIRVADICCGSGNFLLSALEFISNCYIVRLINDDCEKYLKAGLLISSPGNNCFHLSFACRREILLKNIWGVDIDPLAVEVAKFSLCLKLLENTSSEEIDSYAAYHNDRILPRLENNIKNGNSLIGPSYLKYDPEILDNSDLLEKIRMFDWKKEFSFSGFDAIIGNPPYIRVQNMAYYSPKEYVFYKSKFSGYETSTVELLDKYYMFIEQALNLLKNKGAVGYVVPHKFMTISSGEILRRFLSSRGAVRKIIHFGTHQVFKNRSTYTCILILGKPAVRNYEFSFVRDWNAFISNHQIEFMKAPASNLGALPWILTDLGDIHDRLTVIQNQCSQLQDMADIFVGVQTSNDEIYIISAISEDDYYVYFKDKNGTDRKVEKGILRKSIYDARLQKYQPVVPNTYIIFPYHYEDGKNRLIDISVMRADYPYAFAYLSAFKTELDRRSISPPRTADNWYAYGRSQSLRRFTGTEHLIWPVLSLDSNYVYDNDSVVFTGGGNGPYYGIELKPGIGESVFYIQAVLNHWLLETLVKSQASVFRGGYYSHGKQFIAKLPIFRIDFSIESQKKLHDDIVSRVHQLEKLHLRMNTSQNSASIKTAERAINTANSELSSMIDRLYGIEYLSKGETDENS